MRILDRIKRGEKPVAVVGLGYVGLPLAVAFAEKVRTVGFDVNEEKINTYLSGIDPTHEVGDDKIRSTALKFTADQQCLSEAGCIIVAVPTPVRGDKTPDLALVVDASYIVGKNLSPGSIIVFESTVYPGVTEEVCIPVLEEASGLVCGRDFKVGYSPERINPGDKVNRLENICKIVSGLDDETLADVAELYAMIIEAEIHRAPCIKVAEAAKLVENAQRDINIAFMNELAMAFERMDICTADVVAAMNTKWNALRFSPGLVGGHCIGIDPYYFIYRAETMGYNSQIIAAGRRVNDGMARFIADKTVKTMIQADQLVKKAKVYVFGATFKENCPDTRNSKAVEVCTQLVAYGIHVNIVDPQAEMGEINDLPGCSVVELAEVKSADCILFLVAHREFCALSIDDLRQKLNFSDSEKTPVVIDVKSIFSADALESIGAIYWSL